MAQDLALRGPDEERIAKVGSLGVAFRRLSIVDVEGGSQPISNEDGSVIAVANGEIFNHLDLAASLKHRHRFRSRSDCEVIVHLYEEHGAAFVEQLRGMFALALYDHRRRRLLLARDRFGIKPLFYAVGERRLVFASELKALWRCPDVTRDLDWTGVLSDPALNGTLPLLPLNRPTAWFVDIHQVPAGTVVEVGTTGLREYSYWSFPTAASIEPVNSSADEFVREYAERLSAAVDDSLMSDVEVGLSLSGGIDSTAIAAFASTRTHLQTFTVLSSSTLANGDALSAAEAAGSFGLENHQIVFSHDQLDWSADQWKRLLWLCESPLTGAEQLYKYELLRHSKALRPDLKVMLTGQGSDEFNGGYSTTLAPDGDWDYFIDTLAVTAAHEARRRNAALAPWDAHFGRSLLKSWLSKDAAGIEDVRDIYHAFTAFKHVDLQVYNCWLEDRVAAANGIENRVPFLDHRVVELGLAVPPEHRPRLLWDKTILRDAVADRVPPSLARRPKVPFFHGTGAGPTYQAMVRLLSKDDAALVEEAFSAGTARDFVDRGAVRDALGELREEASPLRVDVLLRLVNLGLLEQMARNLPPAPARRPIIELSPILGPADLNPVRLAEVGLTTRETCADDIPVLADGVAVVRRQDALGQGELYIAIAGHLEYELGEEADTWHSVLTTMDGRRSLAALCAEHSTEVSDVRDQLREAIDAGIVVIQPAGKVRG